MQLLLVLNLISNLIIVFIIWTFILSFLTINQYEIRSIYQILRPVCLQILHLMIAHNVRMIIGIYWINTQSVPSLL